MKIKLTEKAVILLLFFFLSINVTSFSQTGPGGIGNSSGANGEPELKLWLLPDSLGLNDGDEVDTWTDYSGNNNDLTGAGSNGSPVYYGDTVNGHSAVFFEDDLSRAVINSFAMPSEAVSVFFVLRTDGTQRLSPLSYAASDADDNEYMFISDHPGSGDFASFVKGNAYAEAFTYNDNNWKILTHQWRSSDGRMYLHEDGSQIYNTTHQAGASITSGGFLSIGAEQDALDGGYQSDDDFEDGEMAEVIMYGSSLKQAQRTVIENYLAQKYGLDDSLATDYYQPGDASYTVAMTGMGKESDGTTKASCDGLVITENGGFDDGEYLLTAHDGAVNTEATIDTASEVINAGVDSAWNRAWYIDKTTVSGGVNAKIAFDFGEGINGKYPGELSNYKLLYRANLSDNYSIVTTENTGVQNGDQIYFSVTDANLSDGYYTLGSTDAKVSPLTGVESQTWYTLKSGDWEDWETWTLDPSGSLPDNPAKETPSAIDDVVILSGKSVTVNTDNVSANKLTVDGRLDFQNYSGQSFGTIKGSGRILLSGDNFPAGDASHFVTEGKGEGTVVYYGTDSFTLDKALEFYNLEIEMDNTDDTLTLLKDYTVNGDFYINEGTFRINSDTSDNNDLTIDLEGALLVEENGAIATGEADARHQLNLYGNFTNDGIVKFTNRTAHDYNSEASDGIVDVNFLNTTSNQKIQCNNTTNFYRIEIDKSSQTYQLSIEASNSSYFNLFGAADYGHGDVAQLADNENALGLISGTVRLENNVDVPILNNTGNYNVSESARLWIDGGATAKNNGTAIVPYGVIRVSDGTLDAPINSGITTRENGLVKVEGGTLSINQLRTSVFGASNVGGYVQTGGTTNILGGSTSGDYYCFNLTYPGNVFNMSGGTLHIHEAEGKGGIFINSDEVNQNVTGGTVIMDIQNGEDFPITSKAPFWNVIIRNSNSGTGKHILTNGENVGSTDEDLSVQDLHVLNDLTIETGTTRTSDVTLSGADTEVRIAGTDYQITSGGTTVTQQWGSYLDVSEANLNVGGDLTIEDDAVLDVWDDSDNSQSATLTFSGNKPGVFHIGNITNYTNALIGYKNSLNANVESEDGGTNYGMDLFQRWTLPLYNLIVDKGSDTLVVSSKNPGYGDGAGGTDLNKYRYHDGGTVADADGNPDPDTDEHGKNVFSYMSTIFQIENEFDLKNGTFSQVDPKSERNTIDDTYSYGIQFNGPVSINGTLWEYEEGVTYRDGKVTLSGVPDSFTINTTEGSSIGNLSMRNSGATVSITSDLLIERFEMRFGKLDIGKHELKVDILDMNVHHNNAGGNAGSSNNILNADNMIQMAGKASDGGLSLKAVRTINNNYAQYDDSNNEYMSEDWLWYPIGTNANSTPRYTPAIVYLHDSGTTDGDEYINVNVTDEELQTTDLTGGDLLSYYWNVDYEGYASGEEPTVSWLFQYDNGDIDGGTESNYVPGKVMDGGDYNRSDDGGVNAVKDGGDGDEEGDILGNDPRNIVIFNGVGNSSSTVADDDIESATPELYDDLTINSQWQDAWPNTGFTLENANYTAGEANRFDGSPEIYYSIKDGNWHDPDTWSTDTTDQHEGTAASDFPQVGDVVFIAGNSSDSSHLVLISEENSAPNNIEVEELTFRGGGSPVLVIQTNGNLNSVDLGNLKGEEGTSSTIVREIKPDTYTLTTDIGEWSDILTNEFQYKSHDGGTTLTLPTDLSEFPNLTISGNRSGNKSGAPQYEVILSHNITVNSDLAFRSLVDFSFQDATTGTVEVADNVNIGSNNDARVTFPQSGNWNFEIGGDLGLLVNTSSGWGEQAELVIDEDASVEHRIQLGGNLVVEERGDGVDSQSPLIDLYANTGGGYVILELSGSANSITDINHSGGGALLVPELYRIEMNKGTDTTSTFTFEDNFTLNGPTSGAGVDKAIDLQNGKLILNDPDINVDLTTGDDDFYIPGTAGLELRQGTANASGNSGILLDGKLHVNGGTVDMSGGDNYIEYSASGNATIEVSADSLIVGSQIRRGLTSTEGILNYTQSGGTVIVGNDAAPENNRGVFEILNTNSSFNHTGGELIIARAQDNPSRASFYFDPETATFAEESKIQFGNATTPADDVMGIYSTKTIPHILVDGTNTPALQQWTIPLTVTDSLEIQSGAKYNANGLDLTLEGDLIANGSFISNNNTTYISGSSLQEITGSPAFWNLEKDQNNTLRLNNDITVNNELRLNNGTLDDNGNTLHAKGDVWMDAVHNHGNSGNGIEFDGTELQVLQSNSDTAAFGKLSLNNPGGSDSVAVFVPEDNHIRIENALQMEKGIFDIGKNLLVLEENAEIIEQSAFSSNNMIQTNISFTDAGIKKYFPAISTNTEFIYPIGSAEKYTPVEFDISNKDAGGSIRVKAANEIHPTITNDDEPCDPIHDTSNVLKYHWIIEADGVSGFSGNAFMKYYEEDIQIDNSLSSTSYDTTDYIAARLLPDSLNWNKYGSNTFNETDQQIEIDFTGTDDQGISGDYTAGIEDRDGSCEGAIPDEVPIYISITNGDWTDETIWDTYPEEGGNVPGGGPKGAAVIIEHEVAIPKNYIVGYKTTIDTGGVDTSGMLKLGKTYGHRLGIVDGKGTLQLERGDLPAGVYEEFFSADGGTLEYSGTGNYDVLGGIPQLNNLKFSGTGDRRLANLDVGLYGNLDIMGADNNLRMINEHDRNQSVQGDITFTQGQVDAGNSSSALLLNGDAEQAVSGNFTGSNAWYNVELDNTSNVVVEDSLNLTGDLTFTAGRIVVPDTALITIDNSSEDAINDADNTKYVEGPLRKLISDNGKFVFPIGYSDYYGEIELLNVQSSGTKYWETQYYHYNPYNDGYYPDSTASPLVMASQEEYWRVKGPDEQADVKINWNSESNLSALVPTISELSLAEWDAANIEWIKVGDDVSGDLNSGSATTTSQRDLEEHQYTFASEDYTFPTVDPDPVETDICEGQTATVRFNLTGESPWDTLVYHHPGIGNDTLYDISSTPLDIDTLTADGEYYAIKIVDKNGNEGTELGDTVDVTVHSPPSPDINGDTAVCEGALITYDVVQESDHYYSWNVSAEGTIESGANSYYMSVEWQNYGTALVEVTEGIQGVSGCETTVDTVVTVYETPQPDITATPNPVCYGDTVELNANTSPTGSSTYEYSWTPADSVESPASETTLHIPPENPDTTHVVNTFEVEVINQNKSGCSAKDSIDVTLFRKPETGNQYYVPNDFDQE